MPSDRIISKVRVINDQIIQKEYTYGQMTNKAGLLRTFMRERHRHSVVEVLRPARYKLLLAVTSLKRDFYC
jgi:hypothetical protein